MNLFDTSSAAGAVEALRGCRRPDRLISAVMWWSGVGRIRSLIGAGAGLLGFRPEECVVEEDAPSGVGSGVVARACCVAVAHSAEGVACAAGLGCGFAARGWR